MKDLEKEEMDLIKGKSEHHEKCTVSEHDVCICEQIEDYEKVNKKPYPLSAENYEVVDHKKAADELWDSSVQEALKDVVDEKPYGGAFEADPESPHEKERQLFAAKREALGKPPKREPGQTAKEQRAQLLLGCLVESIISSIRIVEASEGKQFFHFDVPLSDNRTLSVQLKGN